MIKTTNDHSNYDELPDNEKQIVKAYYKQLHKNTFHKLHILAVESSVQLCYQNARFIFEFVNPQLKQLVWG